MITNRKFIVTFSIFFLLYLLPEIFINDAMLYFSGGIIGGSLSEVFRKTIDVDSNLLFFSIWLVLIVLLVFLYLSLKKGWLKYSVLIIIAFTLYIIDNLFAFIPIFDMDDKSRAIMVSYLVIGIEILIKSLALSWIYGNIPDSDN